MLYVQFLRKDFTQAFKQKTAIALFSEASSLLCGTSLSWTCVSVKLELLPIPRMPRNSMHYICLCCYFRLATKLLVLKPVSKFSLSEVSQHLVTNKCHPAVIFNKSAIVKQFSLVLCWVWLIQHVWCMLYLIWNLRCINLSKCVYCSNSCRR